MNQILSKFAALQTIQFLVKSIFANSGNIIQGYLFAIIVLIMLHIGFGNVQLSHNIAISSTFCASLLAMVIISNSIISELRKGSILKNLSLIGLNDITLSICLLLAITAANITLTLPIIATSYLLFDIDFANILKALTAITISIPNITAILLLNSMISSNKKNSFTNFILVFPFLVPCLILLMQCYTNFAFIKTVIGITFIYIPLFILLSSKLND